MSKELNINDWLDDERDALTGELEAALAPRRPNPEAFGAGVRERVRRAEAEAQGDTLRGEGPARMERTTESVSTGGLGWAAGLTPPMLLSKAASKTALGAGTAAASKAGAKATLKAVPALAATPFFVLFMILATLVYAIRGQLRLPSEGEQRTDEQEAAAAVRGWWVRNLVPTIVVAALGAFLFVRNPATGFQDALLLILLGSTFAAMGQVAGLSAAGLASRKQVGSQMGGFLLFVLGFSLQAQQFMEVPGSASTAWRLERIAPFLIIPSLLLSALICFAVGSAEPGQTRRRVKQALGIWAVVVGGLGALWANLGLVEVTVEDVDQWFTEATEPQLLESSRWDGLGRTLRLMDAAGAPMPDLEAFEEAVREEFAKEGSELSSHYLLPLIRMDRALGTGFAAVDQLPDVVLEEIEGCRDDVDVTQRVIINSRSREAVSLLGFADPARFDEYIVAGVRRMRGELAEFRGADGGLTGPRVEGTLRRLSAACGDEAFESTWRPLVTSPSLDIPGIVAGGRAELVRRILEGAPAPDRYRVVDDYLNAADMLDFIGAPEAVALLQGRVHRALLDTWTLREDLRRGAFQGSAGDEERTGNGALLRDRLTFIWMGSTAVAVEAMARWGVPAAPADASRMGIDLLALEEYLVSTARSYATKGFVSYSALAAGALARLRTLPEFQEQLEVRLASSGPLDALGRMALSIAAVLFSVLALVATLRAPVEPAQIEG